MDSKTCISSSDKATVAVKDIIGGGGITIPSTCFNLFRLLIPRFKTASLKPFYRWESEQKGQARSLCAVFSHKEKGILHCLRWSLSLSLSHKSALPTDLLDRSWPKRSFFECLVSLIWERWVGWSLGWFYCHQTTQVVRGTGILQLSFSSLVFLFQLKLYDTKSSHHVAQAKNNYKISHRVPHPFSGGWKTAVALCNATLFGGHPRVEFTKICTGRIFNRIFQGPRATRGKGLQSKRPFYGYMWRI